MALTLEQLMDKIRSALSDDLLSTQWRHCGTGQRGRVDGHCAIASEAFYHIVGGKDAGFVPVVCGYGLRENGDMVFGNARFEQGLPRETHWWICAPDGERRGKGKIYDITATQYDTPFPYQEGKPTGFMQPQRKPSRRAQILIERVALKIGDNELINLKNKMVLAWQRQQNPLRQSKQLRKFR